MMNIIDFKIILLFAMFFCHIIDDYYLQGILASMKQRSWWEKNAPGNLYKNDYRMALYEHAFSWSFMITLPLLATAIYQQNVPLLYTVFISYIINTLCHAYVDNLKANKHKINLIEDQRFHFVQIFVTWLFSTIFI